MEKFKLIVREVCVIALIYLCCATFAFADNPTDNYLVQVGGKYVTEDMEIDDLIQLFGQPKLATPYFSGGKAYTFNNNDCSEFLFITTRMNGEICDYGTISRGFSTPDYSYGEIDPKTSYRDTIVTATGTGELLAFIRVKYTGAKDLLENMDLYSAYLNQHTVLMYNAVLKMYGRSERIVYNDDLQTISEKLAKGYSDLGEYCWNNGLESLLNWTGGFSGYDLSPNPLQQVKGAYRSDVSDGFYPLFMYRWIDEKENNPYYISGTIDPKFLNQQGKAHIKLSMTFTNDPKTDRSNSYVLIYDSNQTVVSTTYYGDMENGTADLGYFKPGSYSVKVVRADADDYKLSTISNIRCVLGESTSLMLSENEALDFMVEEYDTANIVLNNTYSLIDGNTEEKSKGALKIKTSFDNTLVDAEKNRICLTVKGPNGAVYTKSFSRFNNGIWDLGEVEAGEYTILDANSEKENYVLDKKYSYNEVGIDKPHISVDKNTNNTLTVNYYYSALNTDDGNEYTGNEPSNYLVRIGNKYVSKYMTIDDLVYLFGKPKLTTPSFHGGNAYTFYNKNYTEYLYIETNADDEICVYGTVCKDFSTPQFSYGDINVNGYGVEEIVENYEDVNNRKLLAFLDCTDNADYKTLLNNDDFEKYNMSLNKHAVIMYNAILALYDRPERISYNEDIQSIVNLLGKGNKNLHDYCADNGQRLLINRYEAGLGTKALPNPLQQAENAYGDTYNGYCSFFNWYYTSSNSPFYTKGIVDPSILSYLGKANIKVKMSFTNDPVSDRSNSSVIIKGSNGEVVSDTKYGDMKINYGVTQYSSIDLGYLNPGTYTVEVKNVGIDSEDYTVNTKCNIDCASGSHYNTTVSEEEPMTFVVKEYDTVTIDLNSSYNKSGEADPTTETGTLELVATFDGKPETKDKNGISFKVTGSNYSESIPYSRFTNDVCEIKGLAVGEYTVTESGAEDEDYDLTTSFTVGDNETNKATVTKDATVTMTVAHKYVKKDDPKPEPEKGTLKVTASFDDLLTDAEKDNVTFTVSGPKNFESLTKEYREFKNGIWDLGEVVTGEYTITETNIPDKKNYILKKTFNGKEANESIISVKKNAVSTIDIVNSFIFDHIDITDSDVKLLTSKYAYNGKNIKPVPIITVDGISLKQGTDYTVKYKAKCKKIGKHTLTIEGKGRYRGKITKSYSIFLDTLKYKLKVTKDLGRSVVVISPKNLKPTKANKCKFQVKIFKDKKLKKKWCNKIPPITYKTFDKTKFVIDSSNKFKFNKGKKYYIIIRVINGKKQSKWSKVKVFKGKG